MQIADFGLSRQAITSKVETDTYGTGNPPPPPRHILSGGHVPRQLFSSIKIDQVIGKVGGKWAPEMCRYVA